MPFKDMTAELWEANGPQQFESPMTDQASQSPEDNSDLNPIQQSDHARRQNPQVFSNLKRPTLLRLPEVIQRVGIKKTKLYELQKAGRFPMSVQITSHAVGWVEEEISAWIVERIAASRSPAKLMTPR